MMTSGSGESRNIVSLHSIDMVTSQLDDSLTAIEWLCYGPKGVFWGYCGGKQSSQGVIDYGTRVLFQMILYISLVFCQRLLIHSP